MIFHSQTHAARFKRALWLASALTLLEVSGASANGQFSIDNVAAIAKKLAVESFKPPQPIPEYLKQIGYDDYREIRFDPEQSLWKDTDGNFQVQFIHLNPAASVWLLPVAVLLVLSIPLSVYSSRAGLGSAARRWRLFLIPEELDPPQVIRDLQAGLEQRSRQKWQPEPFVRAVADPDANAIHVALLRGKVPRSADARTRNRSLQEKSLREGPASLTPVERAHLLRDAESMAALHRALWQINPASEPPLAETQQRSTVPVLEPLQQSDSDEPADRADLSQTGAHWQTT